MKKLKFPVTVMYSINEKIKRDDRYTVSVKATNFKKYQFLIGAVAVAESHLRNNVTGTTKIELVGQKKVILDGKHVLE